MVAVAWTPKFEGTSIAGLALPGGKLYTYQAGSTTPIASYTDRSATVQNTNPVILDAGGRANVWLTPGVLYKLVLTSALGVTVWTTDNFSVSDPSFAPDFADDLLNGNGAALIGVKQDGVGALSHTLKDKVNLRVDVADFMTQAEIDACKNGGEVDVSMALQKAIDFVCPVVGDNLLAGEVYSNPLWTLRVDTPVNATNSRIAGTRRRDGLKLWNLVLLANTGQGKPAIETTGSQWLEGDITILTDGAPNASSVGLFQGCSVDLPQTQNQKLRVKILMKDDMNANGGRGTVGIWQMGAEENTFDSAYVQANLPFLCTSYKVSPNTGFTAPSSYQNLLTSHSTGVNTFSGETFFVSLGRYVPPMITEDVNSLRFENLYLANQGSGGGNLYAWAQYGDFAGGGFKGTIEQLTGIFVAGTIRGAEIFATFGGVVATGQPKVVLSQSSNQGRILNSRLSFLDTSDPNRNLFQAAPSTFGEQISCFLRNVDIDVDSPMENLSIPENVLWNASTGDVNIRGLRGVTRPYRLTVDSNRAQIVDIPKTLIYGPGGPAGAEIVRFYLPTVTGAANALGASVRVRGLATIQSSTTSGPSTRYVDAVLSISVSAVGVISVSPANVNAASQADTNGAANSITNLVVSGTPQTNFVQIVIVASRTGANNEAIEFQGTAEMMWSGNEARAPKIVALI